MITDPYQSENHTVNDLPSGGFHASTGCTIVWQKGPLGRGDDRTAPNGAFVETVIKAARDRIDYYQQSKFACAENAEAIRLLDAALKALNSRTARRESAGVEGTHEGA